MKTTYELRHIRDEKTISRETFESAREAYAFEMRDPDGSIPWEMYAVTWKVPYYGKAYETKVNPWTGEVIA